MGFVMAVVGLGGGLAFVGRGLWVWLRGGPLVVKASGREWSTVGRAAAFWLLIGVALLVVAFLPIGAWMGLIGLDAGFWLGFFPPVLACLAVIAFMPRKGVRRPDR